ncbi:MAG: nitronate monooxygenase [Desulfobulbaceae bacterium]|nr:nitronate monooxygenase [Desulfobulbaceae bacterium]
MSLQKNQLSYDAEAALVRTKEIKEIMTYPKIIQGGMGIGVSNWRLARAVSEAGQLGVVSGACQHVVLARRLQDGDPGGHYRRAFEHFPVQEFVSEVMGKYFVSGGKSAKEPYVIVPVFVQKPGHFLQKLAVLSTFAEVYLAKQGHDGLVGINLLEKTTLPNIFSLYGAMLADVDYVIMGAGIPREIPGVLDRLAGHGEACLKLSVVGQDTEDDYRVRFDPKEIIPDSLPELKRPKFLAIVSSVTLALMLAKKSTGRVDGFVVEGPTAGGHNAPPRGKVVLDEKGEPVYGGRDKVDFVKLRKIGLPFWIAGSYGTPEKLVEAIELGAEGIQVGTAFAFTDETGFSREIKDRAISMAISNHAEVFTDPKASPTGFPFKVLLLKGSLSEEAEYNARPRNCDCAYLRSMYKKADGTIGYRCSAEPEYLYEKKGGDLIDTIGRVCLCNSLLADVDIPQMRNDGYVEKTFVTCGNDIISLPRFLGKGDKGFSATDVVKYLLSLTE